MGVPQGRYPSGVPEVLTPDWGLPRGVPRAVYAVGGPVRGDLRGSPEGRPRVGSPSGSSRRVPQ
jgi:hypothetical protein